MNYTKEDIKKAIKRLKRKLDFYNHPARKGVHEYLGDIQAVELAINALESELKKNTNCKDIKENRYTKEINNILTKAKEKDKTYNPLNYFFILSPDVVDYLKLEENTLLSIKEGAVFYDGTQVIIAYDVKNVFKLYKNITDEILNQN